MSAKSLQAIARCIGCRCHDFHACINRLTGELCSWLELDRSVQLGVCSECAAHER